MKETLGLETVRLGKLPSEQFISEQLELVDLPGAVEHLGDNRDIGNLAANRRINGFGTAVVPPETNSSISTVGRAAPTFTIEQRKYVFQFMEGKLAFTVTSDGSKHVKKAKREFMKKNKIKLKLGIAEVERVVESPGDSQSLSDLVEYYIHNSENVEGRIWLLAALRSGADVSEDSSCIFDAVSRPSSERQLDVTSSVKCDVLEAVDVFVSIDENDERIFLDYSRKAGMMLGIGGTGGMKSASAVKVERSKLRRTRIVLDYDVRHKSYIAIRS